MRLFRSRQVGYPVPNEANKFAVGSPHGLVSEPDGSVIIHISNKSPGKSREPNWLPAPASGKIVLTARFYDPTPVLLEKRWAPPAVKALRSESRL